MPSSKKKKKSKGRTTPKKCFPRSAFFGRQMSHKFVSRVNETTVCSWCYKPENGPLPTLGLDVEEVTEAKQSTTNKKGKMFT